MVVIKCDYTSFYYLIFRFACCKSLEIRRFTLGPTFLSYFFVTLNSCCLLSKMTQLNLLVSLHSLSLSPNLSSSLSFSLLFSRFLFSLSLFPLFLSLSLSLFLSLSLLIFTKDNR